MPPESSRPAPAIDPPSILESMSEGVSLSDENGIIVYTNPAEDRMFGYAPGELVGRSVAVQNAYPPDENARRVADAIAELKRSGRWEGEWRRRRKDGSEFVTASRITAVEVGGRRHFLCVQRDVTAGKRQEQALREAEQRWRAIVERAPVGIAEVDLAGRYLDANPRFCEIRRLSREALLASDFVTVTHPDDRAPDIAAWEKLKTGELSYYSVEKRFRGGDGRWYWALVNCSLVRDAEGRPLYAIRVADDITERKLAAARMRESEERFRTIAETAHEGIWLIDTAARTLFVNDRLAGLLGQAARDMVGRPLADFVFPEDEAAARERLAANLAGRAAQFDFRLRRRDGGELPVLAATSPVRDSAGRIVGALGMFADLTERKRGEAELRLLTESLERRVAERTRELTEANQRLVAEIEERRRAEAAARREQDFSRLLIDSTTEGIVAIDPGFRHTVWNSGVEAMTGVARTAALGRTVFEAFPQIAGSPVEAAWRAALAGRPASVHERAYSVEATGRAGFYDGSFAPLYGADRTIIGAIAFLRDTTERHRMDEAVRQSQRLEAIAQLTGGVAHDFNNLLMIVGGNLELLKQQPAKAERVVGAIERAIARGQGLTRQLLSFSRRQALQPKVLDLHARTSKLLDLLRPSLRGDIEIAVDVADDAWPVEVDPGELELALLNVAVNARDAMPKGGRLDVSVRNVRLAGEPAGLSGDFVRIAASDTGSGIPAQLMGKVFEPFFTTKEVGKGTGLGLSQVHGFATQSGGTATLESAEGQGTTVTVYLPRSTSPLLPPELEAASQAARRTSGTILVVEDNDEVAEVTAAMLESLGYAVERAASARRALDELEAGRRVDLVLTDIVMPGGVSGIDLARTARGRFPGLPVVLTTGYSAAAREAADEGFVILSKPFQLSALERLVRTALEQRPQRIGR
jgi:PAS domain S-box-containing protein